MNEINEILYCIYISLLSIIPLLLFRYILKNSKPRTASSHYLTVQEKNLGTINNTDCVPLIKEDHSVSYSSLAAAGGNKNMIIDNNNNGKLDRNDFIGVNGNEVKDLAASTAPMMMNNIPLIIPGAEWKCNRCNRFNDSNYQFCGYCSHKRSTRRSRSSWSTFYSFNNHHYVHHHHQHQQQQQRLSNNTQRRAPNTQHPKIESMN